MNRYQRRWRVFGFHFEPRDLWVGIYIKTPTLFMSRRGTEWFEPRIDVRGDWFIYICLVPCLPFVIGLVHDATMTVELRKGREPRYHRRPYRSTVSKGV